MFKSKKKKEEKIAKQNGSSTNDENAAQQPAELFKFSMTKRDSIDRPASVDTSAKQAVEMLSPTQEVRFRSASETASKPNSKSSSSKMKKSILKNSSTLLTSPIENIEMQSSDFNLSSSGAGDAENVKLDQSSQKPKKEKARKASTLSIPKIPLITHKSFDENLLLPKISAQKNADTRELVLKQNFAGDFGFTVRTSTLLEKVPLTGECVDYDLKFCQ